MNSKVVATGGFERTFTEKCCALRVSYASMVRFLSASYCCLSLCFARARARSLPLSVYMFAYLHIFIFACEYACMK